MQGTRAVPTGPDAEPLQIFRAPHVLPWLWDFALERWVQRLDHVLRRSIPHDFAQLLEWFCEDAPQVALILSTLKASSANRQRLQYRPALSCKCPEYGIAPGFEAACHLFIQRCRLIILKMHDQGLPAGTLSGSGTGSDICPVLATCQRGLPCWSISQDVPPNMECCLAGRSDI